MFYISRSLAFIFKNSIYYWHQRVGAHYVTFVFLQKEFSIQCPVAFTEDLSDQRYPKHRVGKHDGVCRDRVWQDEHHQDNQEEHQVYHLIKADKKLAIHIQILTFVLVFYVCYRILWNVLLSESEFHYLLLYFMLKTYDLTMGSLFRILAMACCELKTGFLE